MEEKPWLEEHIRKTQQEDFEVSDLRALFAQVRAQIETAGTTEQELEKYINEAVTEVRTNDAF